ncbi:MAG: hypothetical protein HY271_08485 [Deltaproteobacteria bacterium]|nr:hypothetical protein [Deltaproteobacteria bacterium]
MTASPQLERRLGAARTGAARAGGADAWTWILTVFALGNLANGVWMLAHPTSWFHDLPAAVPDFGPLNEHFVRDIGSAFVVQGVALLWAAFAPTWRVPLVAPVALFAVLHALAHVYDTARGLVGPAHWMIDLPAVYVPALVMMLFLWLLARARRASGG